jgi:hypothetical protein
VNFAPAAARIACSNDQTSADAKTASEVWAWPADESCMARLSARRIEAASDGRQPSDKVTSWRVRDLVEHTDLGVMASISVDLEADGGSALFRLEPA